MRTRLTLSLLSLGCLALAAQMNISNPFYTVGMKLTGAAGVAHGSYATNEVFDSSGAYTWTVPAGVTQAVVEVWAGGGGGAGFDFNAPWYHGGGGGGGYALKTFAVTNSTVMDYYVGPGGLGNAGGEGYDGEASYFISELHVNAVGGNGALIDGGDGNGGWGGPAGTTLYNGGDGGASTSTDDYGGGGGGSAGTDANGSNGTAGASGGAGGGSGTDGGVGGNGGAAESVGSDGTQPGGGGGGGGISAASNTAGGAGATGRLRISYSVYY